jgi:hypothetical protein
MNSPSFEFQRPAADERDARMNWQLPVIPPEVTAERAIAVAVWFHHLPKERQLEILAEQASQRGDS